MKALSLLQPWATFCVTGAKVLETRSWRTYYKGVLAIHASMGEDALIEVSDVLHPNYLAFKDALAEAGYNQSSEVPRGAILGLVELLGCVPIIGVEDVRPDVYVMPHANPQSRLVTSGLEVTPAKDEHVFGNYSRKRWAWQLKVIRRFPKPIPCKGALNVWDMPADVVGRVNEEYFR